MAIRVGIASLLSGQEKKEVLHYWDVFKEEYHSVGVQSFDHPNLGFQGGECSDVEALKVELVNLCERIRPFEIIVDGFGYFESPAKVVFLNVIKTNALLELHKEINRLLDDKCNDIFELYTPENWVPHISLAMGDLSNEHFDKFKVDYAEKSPSFNQTISNLALVEFKNNGRVELLHCFDIT
ncbi:2'-5' RNA ligase family protein [Bacillus solimangrovi]|uniref:2'-5' RNA ligase n=1 Tax=Bacillus solimangrovi TaxID=1305675 RepID=A0A1E5LAF3_9BACI|nr:2'-5' RNA ligase family protein [Bacillus solimangrovi]OEH91086.1 hypothetical protein BFG57_06865 [Bacillus solimangrovi]